MILLMVPCLSDAETIDVQIKGIDDGIKTTKGQDYMEAVLFAKREAIERAGVKIKALTTVQDLMVNSDYIESKAEGVILPGYNILDIGYTEGGTYQVVLVGKIAVVPLVKRERALETEGVAGTRREIPSRDSSQPRVSAAYPTWEDGNLKIVIEDVVKSKKCFVVMLKFTNQSKELLFLDVDEYNCYMYDGGANRWRYDQYKDTADLWAGKKLAAGASVKSKMSFCSGSSSDPIGDMILFMESQSDYSGRYPFVAEVKAILAPERKVPETNRVSATRREIPSRDSSQVRVTDASQIWNDGSLKIVVEHVVKSKKCFIVMLEFTNQSKELLFLDVHEYNCYMYDETGNKWVYDLDKDTEALWQGKKLAAGSSVKSKMSFCAKSSSNPTGDLVLFMESQSGYSGRYPFVAKVEGIKVD
jgi:hypothetical protein